MTNLAQAYMAGSWREGEREEKHFTSVLSVFMQSLLWLKESKLEIRPGESGGCDGVEPKTLK